MFDIPTPPVTDLSRKIGVCNKNGQMVFEFSWCAEENPAFAIIDAMLVANGAGQSCDPVSGRLDVFQI